MQEYWVRGGTPLNGSLRVQGAKNSVLPLLAASLLSGENSVVLSDVPELSDVDVSVELLQSLGCSVCRQKDVLSVDATGASPVTLDGDLCHKMRSSVLFLGPMLARFGKAELSYPGGCVLGERPIDLHISALMQMGARFQFGENTLSACCPEGLQGTAVHLRYPSVGATENILMAASLAKGETLLYNRAVEPEIDDLIELLVLMGADIQKETDCVRIVGVPALHGCSKAVMPDRIAAFTFLAAALATDGKITLENCPVGALGAPFEVVAAAGGAICRKGQSITVRRAGPFILPVDQIISGPFPAFPTDAGAITLALLSLAQGVSTFEETVFSDRFRVVSELQKMGADIQLQGSRATVTGVPSLQGASVCATDLRAGAALLVAALAAEGESIISGAEYIQRGYQSVTDTFGALGADIAQRSD